MAFQIKNFTSIVAGMINLVRGVAPGITDYNVGSVARTMLEAPASEIEECYQQAFNGIREAIPVATYQSFNFDLLDAAPASGIIHVTVTVTADDVTIPAGTIFSTAAARTTYLSQAPVTISAGSSSADVSVVAADSGVVGNIPANSAFSANPAIAHFSAAINPILFNDGRDLETEDERKQRFVGFIQTLPRATLDALKYGAKTTALFNASGIEIERVRCASTVEPYVTDSTQPIAWVKLYIHNGVGATSDALLAQAVQVTDGYVNSAGVKVPGWKAAGVKVDVLKASEVSLNLAGELTAAPGYDVATLITAAEDALGKYILGLDIEEPFVLLHAEVLVSEIAGVSNFVLRAVETGNLWATSTTSHAVATGAGITWTIPAGLGFLPNHLVQIFSAANHGNRLTGVVASYTGTTITVDVKQAVGTGTHTDWIITLLDPADIQPDATQKLMPGTLGLLAA